MRRLIKWVYPADLSWQIKNMRWWSQVLVIAVVYANISWLVLNKIPMSQYGSPVWPGAGIAIGSLLLWGRSRWLGIFLGAFCTRIANSAPLLFAVFGATGLSVGSLLTVTLILRFTGTNYPLNQVRHVVNFTLCSLFTGTNLQSVMGVFLFTLSGSVPRDDFLRVLWNWWIGDAIGILIYTPLILAWGRSLEDSEIKSGLNWEAFTALASLMFVAYLAFIHNQHVEYLLLPPLLWSGFRFGAKLTTLLVTIIAMTAAIATAYEMGVFYKAAVESDSLLLLQIFMGVVAVIMMTILAIVAENRSARIRLQTANQELEKRVLERTRDLQDSEAKAKQLATQAEAANQAKSKFIANMSHELRSPLNAILGFSQLILRSPNIPPDLYENAGIIYRSGEYLLTLINNILDLSKIEAAKTTLNPKDFDLYRLLDDIEDMFHLRASNQGLTLIFQRCENVPRYICTDEVKLRQILINLLTNSIKFTAQGGITVKVNNSQKETTNVVTIDFQVRDTGSGIATAELPKLFTAFIQTQSGKDAQGGTGLGLAI